MENRRAFLRRGQGGVAVKSARGQRRGRTRVRFIKKAGFSLTINLIGVALLSISPPVCKNSS